jgi:S1-C subfamily serine protease
VSNSSQIRAGQAVFTVGFPQIGLQGATPKFTKGDISSLSGFRDDPREWQISVPVQPGNSGGPLFDSSGNVVGIVVSVLGIKAVAATGHLPQNVNYALKSAYFRALLEENGVEFVPAKKTNARMEDIVERAQKSVVMVLVYGGRK